MKKAKSRVNGCRLYGHKAERKKVSRKRTRKFFKQILA